MAPAADRRRQDSETVAGATKRKRVAASVKRVARWPRAFAGPSRFGPHASVVAWPEDGATPVSADALELLEGGFGGKLRCRPGAPRSAVARELTLTLAGLLLPTARPLQGEAVRAEHAVGLATWNVEGGRALVEVACSLVTEACVGGEPTIPLDRLRFLSPDEDELPEQTLLRNTAERFHVFSERLDLGDGSKLLVLGSGSRQRRVLGLLPDATAFAGHLATNKNVACELLARAGVPVPEGVTVRAPEQALEAARRLGFPVTLKVATGSRQRGVVPCVVSEKALARALRLFEVGKGRRLAQELRLERHVAGDHFRCFVAAGEFVACATAELPRVRGDGKRTIRALVERQHPFLAEAWSKPELAANAEKIVRAVLAGHGHALEDVLPRGKVVPVAFATSRGYAYDVTERVHPEVRATLVRAARALGMFWTGIDVVAPRIDRPFAATGGAVIEVNDIPAFAFHETPLPGRGRGVDMGRAVFRAFFGGRRPDVPLVLVAGGSRSARARIERALVGSLEARGVLVRVEDGGDAGGAYSPIGRDAALDPMAGAIVLGASLDELEARGLGVPAVDVLVDLEGASTASADTERGARLASVGSLLAFAVERRRGLTVQGRDPGPVARRAVARVRELLES